MATLSGRQVQATYKDLLQVSNSNSGVDSTLRQVSDGESTGTSLYLQTDADGSAVSIGTGSGYNRKLAFGSGAYMMRYSGSSSTLGSAITGITGGSSWGFILAANEANSHVVVAVSANDINDGFHVLGPATPAAGAALDSSYFSVQPHEVVVNESSRDMDFRWESDSTSYGLYCQGSDGNVAINTSNAAKTLTVAGPISANGIIEMTTLSALVGIISNPGGSSLLEIGQNQTGNNYAYIDLVGDTTYTDYGFRLIRGNGGANTTTSLQHRGTGDLELTTVDAADIVFNTGGTQEAVIKADGKVGIGTNEPNHELTVIGTISASDGIFASGNAAIAGKYDSGWVTTDGSTTVANGATLTFSHGLSESALNVAIYVSASSDGSYARSVDSTDPGISTEIYGAAVTNLTDTQVRVQLGGGYASFNGSGLNYTSSTVDGHNADSQGLVPFTSKYIRVVAIG